MIIMDSGLGGISVVRALRAGAVDYLAKPPAPAELQAALQSAIQHARRRQRLGTLYPPQGQSPEEGTQRSGTLALPIGSSPAWQRALDLGIGLARGLAAAHRRGVLHRDIKPGKVATERD